MARFCAFLLAVLFLLPFAVAAFDYEAGPASGSLPDRLAYSHQLVKFWWSIYTEYRTTRSLRNLYYWRMECTKLMAESGTAGSFTSSVTNK